LGTQSLFSDPLHKLANHLVVDIGLQQGQADLAQRFVQVLFGDGAPATQALEYPLQLGCERFEHNY